MSRSRSRSPEPAAAPAAAPAEEVKLYVGNLSYDSTEDSMRAAFEKFGTVTDVFLPIDRTTQKMRGFGFVTMADRASADQAITSMDNQELDNRTIRVNESRPKNEQPRGGAGGGFNASGLADVKLYVGNLSFDSTEESLRTVFEQYGTVSDCFLPSDRETGRTRGFAFVTMPAAEAEVAVEKANGVEVDGREIKVNEAQPKKERFDGGGRGGGGFGGRGGGGFGGRGGGGYNGGGGGGYNQGGGGGYNQGGGGGYNQGGGYDNNGGGGYNNYNQGGYNQGGGGGYNQGGGGGYNQGGGGGYDRY